jgi:transposase-like protein
MTTRNRYSREFKMEAVRLLDGGQRPAAEVARELGIPRSKLYQWQRELKTKAGDAFPGVGRRGSAASELEQLRRENAQLREELEILKNAARYFAKESA